LAWTLEILTSRHQHATIAHELAHELGSIAPPIRNRSDVVVEVALAFVLDVEGEYIIREIFPFGSAFNQRVRVFQNMGDAIFEVRDAVGVGVPGCDIVGAGFPVGAVEGWKVVLGNVGVVAPAAELVSIVQSDCELDV
jgi:hypothetical protein